MRFQRITNVKKKNDNNYWTVSPIITNIGTLIPEGYYAQKSQIKKSKMAADDIVNFMKMWITREALTSDFYQIYTAAHLHIAYKRK